MSLLAKYSENKGVIRASLFVVGLLFVFILAKESWAEISGLLTQIKLSGFLLSIILAVFGNVAMAILFNRLLGKYGVEVPDPLAIKMYMVGQVAKYIPGKIWAVAYQISHVAGVAGAKGVLLANIEIMFGSMFMTSIIAAVLVCSLVSKVLALVIVLLGMAGFVLLYTTNVVNRITGFLPRRFKEAVFFSEIENKQTSMLAGIVFFLIFCSIYVSSYLLMLDAVFGFSYEESLVYIALLSAAWLGGVFAFIVPAGMGVREVLFVAISSYIVPQYSVEMLVSIAVLVRFWQLAQDVTGVSLLVFIRR